MQAATYTVTQGGCAGSGSLRDAVLQANANPGKDTINFDASLTTVKPTFDGTPSCTPVDSIVITDSVDIIGTGTSKLNISDNVQWVTPSGNLNATLPCDSGNVVIADGDWPFVIEGDGNPVVAIKNLTFRGNFGVIETRSKPAVLNLENVIIRDSYAGERTQCTGPLIDISGELNMTDVVLFFNKMSNVAPRDAIVSAKGNARLERVRFSSNRAASQFSWLANESSDIVTIRESSFSSPQPRISIAGGTANIINTLVVGQSGGAGVWGLGATINLINSTINLPEQFTTGRGVGGAPAGATHVWMEKEGRVELFNTIVHAGLPIASGALPLVGTSGTAYIVAEADSHITDGSGPSGPSTGDPKLAGNIPTGAPTLDGGDDGKAFDPESLGPLATDLEGNPRIQGPAVEKGAYEVLSNFSREDRYTVQQNTLFDSGSLSVLDNDTTYTPGATLAAILQTPTGLGTLNFNTDGTFTYQPQTGDYGTRIFTYYMTVNGVPANEAQVVLDVQKAFPINTKPDNYSINEGQTLVTTANNAPLVNDDLQRFIYTSGPKGSVVKVIDPPDHAAPGGFVFPPDGVFSYTPASGFSGTDTFTYEIFFEKLGIAGSAETQVTIQVLDTNKPPVAQDDAYSTQQGVDLSISSPGLLANDSDPDGNTLSTVKKSDPAHGTVTFSPGGAFTYFPDAAFVGVDSFTYAASDGKAESNIAATVTITVNAINTPPIAQADKYRIPADSLLSVPARGGVLRNDTDPDGDSLTVFLGQDASNGSVQLQPDGSFSYQPDVGFSGLDSFEYELTDGITGSGCCAEPP